MARAPLRGNLRSESASRVRVNRSMTITTCIEFRSIASPTPRRAANDLVGPTLHLTQMPLVGLLRGSGNSEYLTQLHNGEIAQSELVITSEGFVSALLFFLEPHLAHARNQEQHPPDIIFRPHLDRLFTLESGRRCPLSEKKHMYSRPIRVRGSRHRHHETVVKIHSVQVPGAAYRVFTGKLCSRGHERLVHATVGSTREVSVSVRVGS